MGIVDDIAEFEQGLKRLIIRYEQYFLGLEKLEPLKLLNEVESHARKYTNVNIVNTMMKFKYNACVARLCSYKQYWNRINRLIEDGKYSRERFKMEMHQGDKQEGPEDDHAPRTDPDVARLYHQYVEARKACHLPTENITLDMIAAALAKQKPAIISKYHCSKVEFKVVIEEGTPKIKACPKI